jgi:phosphatidate cytidylyltransferase
VHALASGVPDLAAGPSARQWSDLRLRAISAAILVPLVLLCLWLGGWAWAALVACISVGLGWEWWRLSRSHGVTMIGGGLWLACAAGALVWLRLDPVVGLANLLFILLVVWASDIGAYIVGRAIGGPRLAPAISPGKTWSGAFGGLAAACLAGVAMAVFAHVDGLAGRGWHAGGVAVLLGMVAQGGDLAESWFKRRAGVKDSSQLIPGHGGLLDRLDALLAVAPVAGLLAWFLGRGTVIWG